METLWYNLDERNDMQVACRHVGSKRKLPSQLSVITLASVTLLIIAITLFFFTFRRRKSSGSDSDNYSLSRLAIVVGRSHIALRIIPFGAPGGEILQIVHVPGSNMRTSIRRLDGVWTLSDPQAAAGDPGGDRGTKSIEQCWELMLMLRMARHCFRRPSMGSLIAYLRIRFRLYIANSVATTGLVGLCYEGLRGGVIGACTLCIYYAGPGVGVRVV
ncbi:hypothetical protein ARMGADRAFT_1082672 [Armillaria gallica]|uniref:Uncharacterized protein n=1 Tax=Armillaria gallica TaxID=47427 RepID=A0A2H3D553_ARMGA|nr:hypothetical protein ARMGADRAFT_1082672 [Armillaria gallica]